jgi:cytoskeleton protein RodZ
MPEIGDTLREARMKRRIDITEVEEATKIRAKYLRALENEEWDLLPGPTFVKTFLRTYAEYLEIDPRLLVEEYRQRYERTAPQELTPFAPVAGRRRPPRSGPSPALVIGAVVLALVGLLFAIGKLWPTGDEEPSPNAVTPVATRAAEPASTAKAGQERRRRRTRTAVARLRIMPTGTVSVCLVDARGRALIDNVDLIAGAPTRLFRSKRFRVSFGNGAARMRVGKRTVNVPDRSTPVGYDVRAGRVRETSRRPSCQ